MLVIGADSHTCSAGAVGCLAIGLGAVDVAMALVTGETWFKMPESILINFVGETRFGIGGKDVILHILKKLKRNTMAADRIVEFSGPGLKCLSVDARFAISNMCTVKTLSLPSIPPACGSFRGLTDGFRNLAPSLVSLLRTRSRTNT